MTLAKPRAAEAPRMRSSNRGKAHQKIKERLLAMRGVLRGDLRSINERHRPSSTAAANIVDGAQDHECADERLMAMELSGTSLERVEAVIVRIQEGTYGQCDECGCLIPLNRLDAIPETDACVKCATELERTGERNGSNDEGSFARLADLENAAVAMEKVATENPFDDE
ncbi:MAG: TraR/DksA family transcriptional regulator [Candidatus Peregrinibacteria bacterium]